MLKAIVLAATLLTVAIQAFPSGIYFPEVDEGGYVLKYWDPYGETGTRRVTSDAYALLKLLKELLKT